MFIFLYSQGNQNDAHDFKHRFMFSMHGEKS